MNTLDEASAHAAAGNSALDSFERTHSPAELNRAISSFRAAVAKVPPDDRGRIPHLRSLLAALYRRFTEADKVEDLDAAIDAGREAISLNRSDASCLAALSTVFHERFSVAEQESDLNEAIDLARTATALPTRRSRDGAAALAILGDALSTRFQYHGSVEDLEESIDLARTSLALSNPGITRKYALYNLAQYLRRLAEETGSPAALDEAVAVIRRGINARPREGVVHAMSLAGLGSVLAVRCELTQSAEGLDEALSCSRAAYDMTPEGHPQRGTLLARLVAQLHQEATFSGEISFLDEAVYLVRASEDVRAEDSFTGTPFEIILISALRNRHSATGMVADLDEAIALARSGLTRALGHRLGLAHFAAPLSALLFTRHHQAGALADLDEAIRHQQTMLQTSTLGRRRHTIALNTLGLLQWSRFCRTRDPDDIEAAIAHGRAAVENGRHRSEQAMYLSNLGIALGAKYDHRGGIEDLDESINMARQAVAASTRLESVELARYLANLTHSLTRRYEQTAQIEDLDEAVDAGRRSVSLLSSDHPERSWFLAELSAALHARSTHLNDSNDQQAATEASIEAWSVETAPVGQRLSSAKVAAAGLVAASEVLRATDLLQDAVRLLPEVSPRRLSRSDQEHALGSLAGLASEAASLVLADPRLSEDERPRRALSLLEAGRAILISQALDGRDDLAELHRSHPDVAARFVELRDLLDQPWEPGSVSNPEGDEIHTATASLGIGRERHELAAQFTATLARIRTLPGFGSFGLPPDADELVDAAASGPVVVLNVSAYGSHALLVTKDGVSTLPLTDLDAGDAAIRASAFHAARRSILLWGDPALEERAGVKMEVVLAWLWDAVAAPVLEALGCHSRPSDETGTWTRIWWVPCGLLSLLPIHAAGHHSTASDGNCPRTVIDRVVSSYAPSLRTLIHTRQAADAAPSCAPFDSPPAALVVAMPTTPGLSGAGYLPHVREEVRVLRGHLPVLTVLAEQEAALDAAGEPTKNSVLTQLAHHPIAHFSCHGVSDEHQPSRSRLLLRDHESNPLTAASLAPIALDHAQLAYLSACSTASTKPAHLLDESIHLASAFLIAGFPHVISTLWEIDDQLSVDVADDFYTRLRTAEGKFDVSRAGYALHDAVQRARRGKGTGQPDGMRNPFRWAAYVHIGT
ncbi:hypothetical protein SRB5_15490 [Streptomyces sp. RB5]|uniref:CHAT domain-containing protein n=1 Tax=Streptomyces smaragdinus TaxID=2585196 RepID=A0A7K0CD89_9ACTN|nr:CHAT domain-containing protein [Streptomyces smaragdinus]MQY11431.1 hypothetical protein [Streptomyces smaragdinus]